MKHFVVMFSHQNEIIGWLKSKPFENIIFETLSFALGFTFLCPVGGKMLY